MPNETEEFIVNIMCHNWRNNQKNLCFLFLYSDFFTIFILISCRFFYKYKIQITFPVFLFINFQSFTSYFLTTMKFYCLPSRLWFNVFFTETYESIIYHWLIVLQGYLFRMQKIQVLDCHEWVSAESGVKRFIHLTSLSQLS